MEKLIILGTAALSLGLIQAEESNIFSKFKPRKLISTDADIPYYKSMSCSTCIRSGNIFCKDQ